MLVSVSHKGINNRRKSSVQVCTKAIARRLLMLTLSISLEIRYRADFEAHFLVKKYALLLTIINS